MCHYEKCLYVTKACSIAGKEKLQIWSKRKIYKNGNQWLLSIQVYMKRGILRWKKLVKQLDFFSYQMVIGKLLFKNK